MKPVEISDYTDKDYASFWESGERKYFDEVEKAIVDRLLPRTGKWFVDLGCGFGRFKNLYMGRFEKVVMLDYSNSLLLKAKDSMPTRDTEKTHFVLADIYNLPFRNNSFDVSLMARVFHHLKEPALAFGQIRKILRRRGEIVFNFYNKRNLREIIKYLRKKSDLNPFDVGHVNVENEELLYYSHPAFVRGILKDLHFKVAKRMGVGLFYGRLFSCLHNPAMIERGLSPLLGKYFLSASVYLKSVLDNGEAERSSGRPMNSRLVDILCCPACGHVPLVEDRHGFTCLRCHALFPIRKGIYDFRKQK